MRDLNELIPPNSGWWLESAVAINDDDVIAAQGTYLGQQRSCLLTPAENPFILDYSLVVRILFGVTQGGGGVVLPPGGPPIPIDPRRWHSLSPAKRDILLGLAVSELATLANDPAVRSQLEQAGIGAMQEALNKLRAVR
jgi:hypothetical protein